MRRTRVERRFDAVAGTHDVLLVVAPAGFGKTTAVTQWVASLGAHRPVAWLTLADDDNDPRTLATRLAAAVSVSDPHHRLAHHGRGVVVAPEADAAAGVIRALEHHARWGVLVLSRAETLTAPAALAVLDQVIADLPFGTTLVLDTRRRPALALDRLRAAGRLGEVGAHVLRFDVADAVALVERMGVGPIDEATSSRLVRDTGGWPAALYLTARAVGERSNLPSGGAGLHSDVVDYVTTEIIDRWDAETADLLAQVAVVGVCDADLVGQITQDPAAPARFEALRRTDPVIEPAETSDARFRLEPTVRAVVRAVVARQRPHLVARTDRLASRALASRGEVAAALGHAVAAGDAALVGDMLRRYWPVLHLQRAVVSAALREVGDEAILRDPELTLVAAFHAGVRGERDDLDRYLAKCAEAADRRATTFDTIAGGVELCRAMFGVGGLSDVRGAARRALSRGLDPRWQRLAAISLAWSHVIAGEPASALVSLSSAGAATALTADDAADPWSPAARAVAAALRAIALAEVGMLEQATTAAQDAMRASDAVGSPPSLLAWGLRAAGGLLVRRGRLTEALAVLEDALRLHRAGPLQYNDWPQADLLLTIIPVRWLEGRASAATAALAEVRVLLRRQPDSGALPHRLAAIERQLSGWAVAGVRVQLTPREVDVLRLLRSGRTRRQIGEELYVSPNTVKSHLRSAYRKLGATSRDVALAHARTAGLL